MNTARRFPSITNEGAIRPHEHAFRRWSSPDFGGVPTLDGSPASPWPSAAATERSDTMAAHNPPTFTVYTAEQVRSTPFRKSMPAYEEVHAGDDDGVGACTLLKWTGIGIVAGLAVLTALVVVLNFGGDRALSSVNARSALMGNKADTAAPVQAQTPAKPAVIADTKPRAIELDAPKKTSAMPPTAKVAAAPVKKKK